MKYQLLLKRFMSTLFCVTFINVQATLGASIFNANYSMESYKPINTILKIIHDYEQTCSIPKNCKYKLSSVEEQKILEVDTNGMPTLLWQQVADQKSYSNFVKVETNWVSPTQFQITATLPTKSEVKDFSKKYNLTHNSFFFELKSIWDVTLLQNGKTSISLNNHAKSDSNWAWMFYGKVDSNFQNSAREAMEILK